MTGCGGCRTLPSHKNSAGSISGEQRWRSPNSERHLRWIGFSAQSSRCRSAWSGRSLSSILTVGPFFPLRRNCLYCQDRIPCAVDAPNLAWNDNESSFVLYPWPRWGQQVDAIDGRIWSNGAERSVTRRKELAMSRNPVIAAMVVLALSVLLSILLGVQLSDPIPAPGFDDGADLSELEDGDGASSAGDESITGLDDSSSPLQLWGIVSGAPDATSPLKVILYRFKFPHRYESLGGVSVWQIVDFQKLRDSRGILDRLPLQADLGSSLIAVAETVADVDGRYEFRDIEAGSYMVAAVTEKTMVTPSLELVQLAGEAIDEAARRDVWLRHCGTLSVNVLNDEGTVADARVVLHGQVVDPALGDEAMSMSREELLLYLLNSPMQWSMTDADGLANFPRLPFMEYRVYVDKEPWAQQSSKLTIDGDRQLTLILEKGATIEGVVRSRSGSAIEGALIRLEMSDAQWNQVTRPLPMVNSDIDGRFVVQGLAAGTVELHVEAKGFRRNTLRGVTIEAQGNSSVEVELQPGAVLEGYVRSTSGTPLAGVKVAAEGRSRALRADSAKTETDEDGHFLFDTLGVGLYRLVATSPGLKEERQEFQTGPEPVELVMAKAMVVSGQVVDPDGKPLFRARVSQLSWRGGDGVVTDRSGHFALPLLVEADQITIQAARFRRETIDIDASGGDLGIIQLSTAETIEGIVYSPDGTPLSGARVVANRIRREGENRSFRNDSAIAWSDGEGHFRLELSRADSSWKVSASFPEMLSSESVELYPAGNAVTGIHLVLRWGTELSGIVTGNGVPISDAKVTIRQSSSRGAGSITALSDEAGFYSIPGLKSGEYTLRGSAEGFGDLSMSELILQESEQRRLDLELKPEMYLTGVVIDRFGAPISSAQLRIRDSTGAWRRGVSDMDGAFSVNQLASGLVHLRGDASGYLRTIINQLDPSLGPVEVVLEKEYQLRGVVVDSETGEAISRAIVEVKLAGDGNRRTERDRANDQGLFRVDDLRAGDYIVKATATGFLEATFQMEIPGRDPDQQIIIELVPGGRIIVDVFDKSGATIEGVSINAAPEDEDQSGERNSSGIRGVRSDAGGRGILVGLPDGNYRVRLRHDHFISGTGFAEVKRIEGSGYLRMVLEKGASVRGQVRDASGTLIRSGRVRARGPNGSRTGAVDDSGQYFIGGMAAGSYQLEWSERRRRLEPEDVPRGQIEVSGEQERVLDLHP